MATVVTKENYNITATLYSMAYHLLNTLFKRNTVLRFRTSGSSTTPLRQLLNSLQFTMDNIIPTWSGTPGQQFVAVVL